jgi:hypothetical protein
MGYDIHITSAAGREVRLREVADRYPPELTTAAPFRDRAQSTVPSGITAFLGTMRMPSRT